MKEVIMVTFESQGGVIIGLGMIETAFHCKAGYKYFGDLLSIL